ncbi:MAG: GNAT superfamily N-acetyltransferase [Candidatus Latescibacterota bacterium]|jgi:GNAT superfamily N-acetyltransferase
MAYNITLDSGIKITSTQPKHAEQLEKLQEIVFPTLATEERFKKEHYHKHIALFPKGQFVALHHDNVVGMTSSIRFNFDFAHIHHTFADIIQGGWLTSHQPKGNWLYGADIGTHPNFRRQGIARGLYAARQHTVHALNLKGQVTVGMMNGYETYQNQMTPETYFEKVRDGHIKDPTITAQMRMGFEIRTLLKSYVTDPQCGNCGILIVLDSDKDV